MGDTLAVHKWVAAQPWFVWRTGMRWMGGDGYMPSDVENRVDIIGGGPAHMIDIIGAGFVDLPGDAVPNLYDGPTCRSVLIQLAEELGFEP